MQPRRDIPSVWRSWRGQASNGMDEIAIPAFLGKQADRAGVGPKGKGGLGRLSCVQGMTAMGHLPAVATGSVQAARNADVPPEEAGRSRCGR